MPKIIRNGVEYPSDGSTPVSSSFLANRAAFDQDGNDIEETYLKITESGLTKPESSFVDTAAYHNSIFRGRNITSYYEDGSLYTRITSGNFDDLYVGDYFKAIINGQEITCHIAGFDIYMNHGYPEYIHNHHVVIVPDEALTSAKMNETNITTDGYAGSMMRRSTISVINSHLETTFGEHLLTTLEGISNRVDNSKPSAGYNGWNGVSTLIGWVDSKAALLSEVEVYGTQIWGSSAYDIGTAHKQLPLFQLAPEFINPGRFSWWLRAVVSSTEFATVSSSGVAHFSSAGNTLGVRPRWLIG